jgi:hypothetical protein
MRPPPPMSDDEADFAFMEAISSFISLISVVISVFQDLISSMRSAMVGSDMLVAWPVDAVEVEGEGGGEG